MQRTLIERMKGLLEPCFRERLKGVVLFGSEARGEAACDSDIDLLILLEGPINLGADLRTSIHALYPLVLELERPIDALPVDAAAYETAACSLFAHVKAEGIRA